MHYSIAAAAMLCVLAGCGAKQEPRPILMKKEPFGTVEGKPVELYTITNKNNLETAITNYGGIVVSLKTPDRQGKLADVVLGFDNLDGYLKGHPYFGAIIGRYGNRIAKAKFTLGGVEYKLVANNGENHLHGGTKGFDKVVWSAREKAHNQLELSYTSKDGEEGYPGNLAVRVTYTLTDNNELKIDYSAATDKETIVNLTNHSYFNLAGAGEGNILGHEVLIRAARFTPVDEGLIPTGELRAAKGTVFDFIYPRIIGERIGTNDQQLILGKGYDHNYVLNAAGGALAAAARVREPNSGRMMEVLTTEPGLQFYTGNFLDGSITGKGGKVYRQRYGFCMETQHFPDSPNKPEFPSVVLTPGKTYSSTTVYRFSAEQ